MQFSLHHAKKENNYIEDATDNGTGNDKWESTTLQEWTVPAGKRWILLYGILNRDVSASSICLLLDAAGDIIAKIHDFTAGTGSASLIPISFAAREHLQMGESNPRILEENEQVQLTLGTAQGAGAYASCVVLEVDA